MKKVKKNKEVIENKLCNKNWICCLLVFVLLLILRFRDVWSGYVCGPIGNVG
jgi:hypothetical protein